MSLTVNASYPYLQDRPLLRREILLSRATLVQLEGFSVRSQLHKSNNLLDITEVLARPMA
jgi:hypothetical protein